MRIWLAAWLAACTSPPTPGAPTRAVRPVDVDDVPIPGPCEPMAYALYGMDNTTTSPTVAGPYTFATPGIDICLTLDARDNIIEAHFGATGPYESGGTASLQLALFDRDDNLLQLGWDVTYGDPAETTHAHLEYGVTKGDVLEAKLHVSPRNGGAADIPIALALFEPGE